MKLFKPQVQLFRQLSEDDSFNYFLHSITLTDRTDFKAKGYTIQNSSTENSEVLQVDLLIEKDEELPDFNSITPVTHTLFIGPLPFDNEEGLINVNVYISTEDSATDEKAGDSIVSSVDADEDSRPISGFS